jgi:hypothetical protein
MTVIVEPVSTRNRNRPALPIRTRVVNEVRVASSGIEQADATAAKPANEKETAMIRRSTRRNVGFATVAALTSR